MALSSSDVSIPDRIYPLLCPRGRERTGAGEGIRDTIIGIVTNMLLNSEDIESNLPLVGFAYTKNGDVKVSARTTQSFVDKGIDLSSALKYAAKQLNGVGGGHNIAAGATIPKGKEEEFLDILEKKIKDQLGL